MCIRLQCVLIHPLFHRTGVAYSDIFLKVRINVKLKHEKLVFFSESDFYFLVDWSM